MTPSKTATFLLLLTSLAGCAHSSMRGSVAMKASDREAHVCLGDNEVKTGDKVALFRNVCPSKSGILSAEGGTVSCRKERIGAGEVIRTLNEHYSVVRVDSGVTFDEGTLVEKL